MLSSFPDLDDPALPAWLEATLAATRAVTLADVEAWWSVGGAEVEGPASPLGAYASAAWRRFAVGLFAADLACYPVPVDQVDFANLAFAASRFPRGFRLYLARTARHAALPVGYAAWHPMAVGSFRLLRDHADTLVDRSVIPLTEAVWGADLYLFNYSVVPGLYGSAVSRALVKRYAAEVGAVGARTLTAITVSPHGSRVAARFGMTRRAPLTVEGVTEDVYIWEAP
ncbi:MAG: hypothetical protein R3F60_11475 [bacterium]